MFDRREFLKTLQTMGVAVAVPVLGSRFLDATETDRAPAEKLTGEALLEALEAKTRESLGSVGNCAQASFAVLQEQFDLPWEAIHRGLSTFPGLGFTGETCGAVIGSLMALNLVFGYEAGDEAPKRKKAYLKAQDLLRRFEEERGTTTCRGIHEAATGRWHDLMDPAEAKAYAEAGGFEACRAAVATGVRIAAELILAEEAAATAAM